MTVFYGPLKVVLTVLCGPLITVLEPSGGVTAAVCCQPTALRVGANRPFQLL